MDHPRIRGEHISCSRFVPAIMGSSPHTRGARSAVSRPSCRSRIIPAYAGSTSSGSPQTVVPEDHPRIRGEHQDPTEPSQENIGSSPHTRGAQMLTAQNFQRQRIIPAYAGSTTSTAPTPRWRRDHPRIRGEHMGRSGGRARNVGSSPHTRGALRARRRRCVAERDHPRIRGEHSVCALRASVLMGSSPHTRGAPRSPCRRRHRRRIIPAYAGSTPRAGRACACRRDHPRIRGEHPSGPSTCRKEGGSSPHTRGAHPRDGS